MPVIKKPSLANTTTTKTETSALTPVLIPEEAGGLLRTVMGDKPLAVPVDRSNTLTFYDKMSSRADAMARAIPGIQPGQPVLFIGETEEYVTVERFILLRADLFYTRKDRDGLTVEAVETKPDDMKVFSEDYQCVLGAFVDDQLVPCKGSFRRTRSGPIISMLRSQAKVPTLTGRLMLVGKFYKTAKTARATGDRYELLKATITVATPAESAAIAAAMNDPDFLADLKDTNLSHEGRLGWLRGLGK